MSAESFKRKLTAILSADVKGYSRLMGEDEAETVKTITAYRRIMGELIHQHRGRVIDSPGDNILAEFGSVVDAVQCAVAAQNEFKARNADLPENRRMEFRIGVNLGDVIEEEGRIYGDGVNIAARLEALADPGGICISKTAFEQIETKLPLGYEFLGEQEVKNIVKPVGAYKVLMEPRVTVAGVKARKPPAPVWRSKGVLAGAVAFLVLIIGAGVWNFHFRTPKIEPVSEEEMAFPLPDKPSIVVLPFVNMSEDKDQEYFSDGLTEEIITALSKTPKLFVIARNSSFVYKGKAVNVQQVNRELGVRYVLEGSVRRSGDQLRITAQLIDATSGNHLWAERYDREMKDVFAIQDEITMKILASFLQLTEEQMWHMRGRHPSNLQAYLKLLEGIAYWNESKYRDAMRYFEEALSLDSHFPGTYGWIAWTHMINVWFGPSATRAQSLDKAIQFAERAKALAPELAVGPAALGHAYLLKRDYDRALSEGKLATELDPNNPQAATYLGWTLRCVRRYEEAMKEFERAIRLDPFNSYTLHQIAVNYFMMRRYEDSLSFSMKALERLPKALPVHLNLTMTYSSLNMMEEARAAASDVLKINPNFSLEPFAMAQPYKYEEDTDHIIDALRKAGLK